MSTINAITSPVPAVITTTDNTGNLAFQTAGTTALNLDANQNATFAGSVGASNLFSFKNKIINGNFEFWQRANTQTITTTSGSYMTCDRYQTYTDTASTRVVSRQEFTTAERNAAAEPARNSQYYHRIALTPVGTTTLQMFQRIEGLRQFAGKTVTISFYAKADRTQTSSMVLYGISGGGSEDYLSSLQSYTLTTSWQKFTFTIAVPTLNTGWSYTATENMTLYLMNMSGITSAITVDFAQVQLEMGSVATAFDMRHSVQELQLCQRYYQKSYDVGTTPGTNTDVGITVGANASNATNSNLWPDPIRFIVPMRAAPTVSFWDKAGNAAKFSYYQSGWTDNCGSPAVISAGQNGLTYTAGGTNGYNTCVHFSASAEI